jgi:hypothetical protein
MQLLDGGNHSTDFSRFSTRRRYEYRQTDVLPRDKLLQIINDKDLRRPTPAAWR